MHDHDHSKLITRPGPSALHRTPLDEITGPVRDIIGATVKRAEESLAIPFSGITIGGPAPTDLFPVGETGVAVQPLVDAAASFLQSLSGREQEAVRFAVDDDRHWRSWHNMHFNLMRHGLGLHTLGEEQRAKALDLLRASMSAAGYDNARDIMRLNAHAAELTGRTEEYDEYYYWISIFGTPSSSEPWGWQIDGHHLIVNCLVVGDQMVLTPDFRGSEPVSAESGPFAGTTVFAEEEAKGLALMQSFDRSQRGTATIADAPPRELITTAQVDNLMLGDDGLPVSELSTEQRDHVVELLALYTGRLRNGQAELRLAEVTRHLDRTRFAWMGPCDDHSAFYYRITNPVILVEFDHLPGIIYDNREPSRRHVHTIVRTPNGNDYGRSLLLDHYRRHEHPGSD